MKIGIIGSGAVGAACAMATIMRGCASELVIVNRGRDRAKGMATDMGSSVIDDQGDGWRLFRSGWRCARHGHGRRQRKNRRRDGSQ